MPAIEQAERSLAGKVSWDECVGSVDDAIVFKLRERVGRAKREAQSVFAGTKTPSQLERHPVIETVTYRDQLLHFRAGRIRSQFIQRRQRDINHGSGSEAVEIKD